MSGLTPQQERLLKRNKALVAHCPTCRLNVFNTAERLGYKA